MDRIYPLIVVPLVFIFSILAPRSLSFLPALVCLIPYIAYAVRHKNLLLPDKYLCLLFASIIALSLSSYLWAEFPQNVIDRSGSIVGILLAGLMTLSVAGKIPTPETWPLKKVTIAFAGIVSAIGILSFAEISLHYPLGYMIFGDEFQSYNWNRSLVVLAMSYLPALFLLQKTFGRTRKFALSATLLTLCVAAPLLYTQSQTAQILFVLALAGYGAASLARKWVLAGTAILVIVLTMATPLIPKMLQDSLSGVETSFTNNASIPHRLEVWNFVAEKIQEKPLLGHGVESVRSMKSKEIMPHLQSDSILHPHNAFLQVWVETGLVGAVLACCLLLFILRRIGQSGAERQPFYFGVFSACLSFVSTGYGLWQSWQLGLLFAICALSIAFARISPPSKA